MYKIYNKLLSKLILPLGDKILGSKVMNYYNFLKETENLTEYELKSLQEKKLRELLNFSLKNVDLYNNLDINKNELNNPFSSIKKFPILTKNILSKKTNKLLTTSKNNLQKHSSSGSSGIQSHVYMNKKEFSVAQATQLLWFNWAGYKFGDKILQTGISTNRSFVKRIKDFLLRTKYVLAFGNNEDEILNILTSINRDNEYILAGYASSLFTFANVAEKNNIDINFKTAISWGDKLFDHYQTKINEVFQTNVYETYGCAEGLMMAAEYDLDNLYIMTPNVYLEIVDDKGNLVEDGELGHVLVTNLNNFSMPLIRYKLGDLAIKLPKKDYPTQKKLPYPLLKKVIGRDTDIIKTPNGKYLTVHSFTGIFEYYEEIKQFRVIQKELNEIIVEFIPRVDKYDNVIKRIKNKIISLIDDNKLDITFRRVDNIPATDSGKPQIMINELDNLF